MKAFLLLLLSTVLTFSARSQVGKDNTQIQLQTLLQDAKTNFSANLGDQIQEDDAIIYYYSKITFGQGATQAFLEEKKTGKRTFMCKYTEDPNNRDFNWTMIKLRWLTTLSDYVTEKGGKKEGIDQPGGKLWKFYDAAGVQIAELLNNGNTSVLQVMGNKQ